MFANPNICTPDSAQSIFTYCPELLHPAPEKNDENWWKLKWKPETFCYFSKLHCLLNLDNTKVG